MIRITAVEKDSPAETIRKRRRKGVDNHTDDKIPEGEEDDNDGGEEDDDD